MTPAERLAEAKGMTLLAGELQARGILTASGEMFWGAVNHMINAIADQQGLLLPNGKAMPRALVMDHLQQTSPRNPPLKDSLAVVGELHGNFYLKHMAEARHNAAMSESLSLLQYLLNRQEVLAIPPRTTP